MTTATTAGLYFSYEGDGEWVSPSQLHDQGSHFYWRIGVCDDGTFSPGESDAELVEKRDRPTFDTFASAVKWCNAREATLVADAKATGAS